MAPLSRKFSESQKDRMVTFMECNPYLWKCKFSKQFSRKTAKKMWKRLAVTLNSMLGAQKHCKNWKKTWQRLKSSVKVKAAKLARNGTQSSFSDIEKRILTLIGATAVEGHQDVDESTTRFNFETASKNIKGHTIEVQSASLQNEDQTQIPLTPTNTNTKNNNHSIGSQYNQKFRPGLKKFDLRRLTIATQRFENTIRATDKLVDAFENKIKNRQDFNDKKLKLLEMNLKLKERMTQALVKIVLANNHPNLQ